MSQKNDKDFAFQIQNISKGKFKLGARIEKEFYEENKSVIDTINQYSSIGILIYQNYRCNGKYYGNLRFFYQYLENHKVDISKIMNLLGKEIVLRKKTMVKYRFMLVNVKKYSLQQKRESFILKVYK